MGPGVHDWLIFVGDRGHAFSRSPSRHDARRQHFPCVTHFFSNHPFPGRMENESALLQNIGLQDEKETYTIPA